MSEEKQPHETPCAVCGMNQGHHSSWCSKAPDTHKSQLPGRGQPDRK